MTVWLIICGVLGLALGFNTVMRGEITPQITFVLLLVNIAALVKVLISYGILSAVGAAVIVFLAGGFGAFLNPMSRRAG